MTTLRTLALCPDCGQSYLLRGDVFVCTGCATDDRHELAAEDIYLEHDETWTTDDDGRLVIVQTDEEIAS